VSRTVATVAPVTNGNHNIRPSRFELVNAQLFPEFTLHRVNSGKPYR
jgi:hypothetical protein